MISALAAVYSAICSEVGEIWQNPPKNLFILYRYMYICTSVNHAEVSELSEKVEKTDKNVI